jgi:predicted aspartyl protease
MKIAWLIPMLATAVLAQAETVLEASRVDHVLVLNKIFLNGVGPFRMMVDTGNASSLIRPRVAQRINARATYAVEQVTAGGTRVLPVVVLDEVAAGGVRDHVRDLGVEAMVGDVSLDGVDGVLGQSWLARHDYLLDYRNHRVVVDGEPSAPGNRTAFRSTDGRPILAAEVDGRRADMVLDSGASVVVLFETGGRLGARTTIRTNAFSAGAEPGCVRIAVGDGHARRMDAVRVSAVESAPGLLPANAFATVFVSNRYGFIELTR